MKKGFWLAIILILILSNVVLPASALSSNKWPTSGDSAVSEPGQEYNLISQISNKVTLTLYVLDGGMNGELLSGVDVKAYDAAGNSFENITDSKGPVILSGQPGTWQFILTKDGYKTSNLEYTVIRSQVAATYLQPSQSQEPVNLTINVYEGDPNGTALHGVQVTGQDAAGKSFEGTTDSNGVVSISGQPGTWQFTFTKEGYGTLSLNYNVTETETVAAFLQKTAQSTLQRITPVTQPSETVSLTVYVHDGSLNGTALSGVEVTGKDAAGKSFEGTTSSNGSAVLSGQPGTWQFAFNKEGYGTLELNYNVTETDYGDVYLQKSA